MKEQVGVILWNGSVATEQQIQEKISTLTDNGVSRICVAATNVKSSKLITLNEDRPVGSAIALARALNYCKTSWWHGDMVDSRGLMVINGEALLAPRMVQRMLQISCAVDVRPYDAFMMIQFVEQSESQKYVAGFENVIENVVAQERGYQSCGINYMTRFLCEDIAASQCVRLRDFWRWCVMSHKRIYGMVNTCCSGNNSRY